MLNRIIIGIDIRDLKLAKTGTKTYLEELCKAFKQLESENYQFKFLDTSIAVYAGTSKIGKYIEHFRYQLWKQVVLPIKAYVNHCDILFCTDNFVPLVKLGYKTVPVFHDAFFFEDPADYGKLWLKLYHLTAVPAAKSSVFIVTPSLYAQQQIHKHTGIPLSALKVVYEGPKSLKATPEEDILTRLNLQAQSYILHVGSLFKRKNIPALVYAFKLLKDNTNTSVKLVLAGPSTASKDSNDLAAVLDAIRITGLKNEVILTGYLNDSELAGIYAGALMYVFPSINEGFGIPVLEAFKHNLPVLVANNTCLPEIGGDAVLTFDPFNNEDIYLKMKVTLQDDNLRQDLINKGQIRLQEFSWVKTSLQLLALFRESKE